MTTIEQLYSLLLEEDQTCVLRRIKSEKLMKLVKELKNHEDYDDFHPHNDYLQNIPSKVVLDYFVYLRTFNYIGDNVTLNVLRKVMVEYVSSLSVLARDLRIIVDVGWKNHELTDSCQCSIISDKIEDLIE